MQWFYSADGQKLGPVTREDLDLLAQAGTITGKTLVWQEGMANWEPYDSIAGARTGATAPAQTTTPTTAPAAGDNHTRCAECGLTFAKDEMVAYAGSHVCAECKPTFFQKLKEGVTAGAPGAAALWRDNNRLVANLFPVLPKRCVKCNAPTEGPRKKVSLTWFHPLVYLGLIFGVLPFALLVLILRKRTMAAVAVCPVHASKRNDSIVASRLLVVMGVVLVFLSFKFNTGSLAGVGGVCFAGGVIVGLVRGRFVHATKMTKQHVWLGGCGPEFLEAFPEWNGEQT